MSAIARVFSLVGCLLFFQPELVMAADSEGSCEQYIAHWLDPVSGESLSGEQIFERFASSRIVLLGESHTSQAHHRWQLYTLSALHSRNSKMIVGFEMLPRRVQAALDAWSTGSLDDEEFLEQSEWKEVWGYDAGLYLPLLHFTRQHRLPTIALNIDRELVSRVGQQGWQALAEDQRLGLSDPALASDEYRDSLAELFAYKQTLNPESDNTETESSGTDLDKIKNSNTFSNFVDAQLTWDRAMAEALAAAHRRDPSALVVGIVGRGHLEYGYGIPHQLADMGIDGVDVLLPIDADEICDPLPLDLASAVFVVDADSRESPPAGPRLGIIIENAEQGVRVLEVIAGSVAAEAGILEGDLVQAAAGFETETMSTLIAIIQRQAAGTWLPLKILRDQKTLELLAKFPQGFN